MTATGVPGPAGRPLFRACAPDTMALVDAQSGYVLEVVLENQMPDSADRTTSALSAQNAARHFMMGIGMSTYGLAASVELVQQAGVAAYSVTWRTRDALPVTKFQVLVAASTGAVFAYLDLRMGMKLVAPIIGRTRALQLAMASGGTNGPATSTDLWVKFASTGAQVSVWRMSSGVDVEVNAVTGETTATPASR